MLGSVRFYKYGVAFFVGLLPAAAAAQQQAIENYNPVTDERLKNPEPENWLMTRGNYQGWSYSPLDPLCCTDRP
jgi:alcohol dehydrogenase (cytochrome c)